MPLPHFAKTSSERGAVLAFFAFCVWGVLPVFWKALQHVPALEIFCHRVTWSFVFILLFLVVTGALGKTLNVFRDRKSMLILTCSGAVLAGNWLLFIWAIVTGKVVEASLGYFINPLLNILVGICFFRDRSNRLIWAAILLAAAGVLYQIVIMGHVPMVALALGGSFALYGVLRKIVMVEALPGLFVETALATPFTLGYLVWIGLAGQGAFGTVDVHTDLLLMAAGIATTLPLFGFTYGARRISLTTLGLLQYISPTLTFLLGVFAYNEPLAKEQMVTFVCIWCALALYSYDGLRRRHIQQEDRTAAR